MTIRNATALFALALSGATFGAIANAQEADTVTIVLPWEARNLDVCFLSDRATGLILRDNVIETLTRIDAETGEVEPYVAESWERVDDTTWHFTIRQGINYHDGEPLTAESFAASFSRTLDPDLSCSTRLNYFDGLGAKVEAVDEYTVAISTDFPVPLLPTLMTYVGVGKLPEGDYDVPSREPVGTGPYQFGEWVAGRHITLEEFDGYWGDTGEVKGATYIFREEQSVRAATVPAVEADIAYNIARVDANNPDTDFSYLNSETERLRLDPYVPPLDDLRVRRAINYAIDREGMLGTLYPESYVLADNFVMPSINGANPDVMRYDYNPELARQLIEEARADGVPVDNVIEYHVSPGTYKNLEIPTVFMDMINAVGLNVEMVISNEILGYYKPFPEGMPANMYNDIHDNNSGDAGLTLIAKYTSEGGASKLHEPEIDEMVRKAITMENPERKEVFQEVFAIIREQAYDVMLAHQTAIIRIAEDISYTPTTETNTRLRLLDINFATE